MASLFSYHCATCGKLHEGSPGFSFGAPDYYHMASDVDKAASQLTDDTCVLSQLGELHYFVRVCLDIPIHGFQDPFSWGVWASMSKKSFSTYQRRPTRPGPYFGWFSNNLPCYPETLEIKTQIHPRRKGLRPWIELEPTQHPLAVDYYQGISPERAREIAEMIQHGPPS